MTYVNANQGEKSVITVEIVFQGPGSYQGFGETVAKALKAGNNNASGVKVVGNRPFVAPKSGTDEERAGYIAPSKV